MLWVYLWQPLLTLLAWIFGVRLFGDLAGSGSSRELHEFGHLIVVYAAVICVMGGSLLTWARIEFIRFRNVNRRTRPTPVSVEETAEYAGLPVEELNKWVQSNRLVIYHDAHGHVIGGEAQLADAVVREEPLAAA